MKLLLLVLVSLMMVGCKTDIGVEVNAYMTHISLYDQHGYIVAQSKVQCYDGRLPKSKQYLMKHKDTLWYEIEDDMETMSIDVFSPDGVTVVDDILTMVVAIN